MKHLWKCTFTTFCILVISMMSVSADEKMEKPEWKWNRLTYIIGPEKKVHVIELRKSLGDGLYVMTPPTPTHPPCDLKCFVVIDAEYKIHDVVDGNGVSLPELTWSGNWKIWDYPLFVGKKWKNKSTWIVDHDKLSKKTYLLEMDDEVVSYEKVRVPAGKFKVFKMRRTIWATNDPYKDTFYFYIAPELGVNIKWDGYGNDKAELKSIE